MTTALPVMYYAPGGSAAPPLSELVDPNDEYAGQNLRDRALFPTALQREFHIQDHYYRGNLRSRATYGDFEAHYVSQTRRGAMTDEGYHMGVLVGRSADNTEPGRPGMITQEHRDWSQTPYTFQTNHVWQRKSTMVLDPTAHPQDSFHVEPSQPADFHSRRDMRRRDAMSSVDRARVFQSASPAVGVSHFHTQVPTQTQTQLSDRSQRMHVDPDSFLPDSSAGYVTF